MTGVAPTADERVWVKPMPAQTEGDPLVSALDLWVARWVQAHPLVASEVDCALAVMLKVLDGKCKMREEEKVVMAALYRQVRDQPGERLSAALHQLVDLASQRWDDRLREQIYEERVLAETTISRPVMKRFKARIRREGLFSLPQADCEQEEIG